MQAAKRREFGSWVTNKVLELATTKGIDPQRCVRSRWVLVFKKLSGERHQELRDNQNNSEDDKLQWLSVVRRSGGSTTPQYLQAKARLCVLGNLDPDLGHYKTWSPTL